MHSHAQFFLNGIALRLDNLDDGLMHLLELLVHIVLQVMLETIHLF